MELSKRQFKLLLTIHLALKHNRNDKIYRNTSVGKSINKTINDSLAMKLTTRIITMNEMCLKKKFVEEAKFLGKQFCNLYINLVMFKE